MRRDRSSSYVLYLPHVAEQMIDDAIEHFEPLAGRKLTREDGREITQNLVGFFELLIEWDAEDRKKKAETSES